MNSIQRTRKMLLAACKTRRCLWGWNSAGHRGAALVDKCWDKYCQIGRTPGPDSARRYANLRRSIRRAMLLMEQGLTAQGGQPNPDEM